VKSSQLLDEICNQRACSHPLIICITIYANVALSLWMHFNYINEHLQCTIYTINNESLEEMLQLHVEYILDKYIF